MAPEFCIYWLLLLHGKLLEAVPPYSFGDFGRSIGANMGGGGPEFVYIETLYIE